VFAIHRKIPVEGNHRGLVVQFRHSHQTSVREGHRAIPVARRKPAHGCQFRLQGELKNHGARGDQFKKRRLPRSRAAQQVPGFGQYGFAGKNPGE